jgi:tripartite-type tricarboxylate transporter receptor subunit TctC
MTRYLKMFALTLTIATAPIEFSRAQTQVYPSRSITMIVPFAAGGFVDTMGRHVARALSKALGQSVVVENKTGAGTAIGVSATLQAPADGYTILYAVTGTMTLLPVLPPKPNFNPDIDFVPIGSVEEQPMVLIVPGQSNIKNFGDLIKTAKDRPGALSFASSGRGTETQFVIELLKRDAEIDLRHVPYRGSAAAVPDLLANRIDLAAYALNSVSQFMHSREFTGLATFTSSRLAAFPDLPTIQELGFPNLVYSARTGIYVRSGTPEPIINRIREALPVIASDQAFVSSITAMGSQISLVEGARFKELLEKERLQWSAVVDTLKY